ncbi:uncharacterized protein LOC110990428 [Acanthaster planci]|uniref:Uncharacterized protein LOC110990428 n=1 Tax=Acanthaster planci TaxID=133434 RepID=A0A8B8A5A2_ACAPL|nr:uncharacterized protein LOC110990428 [Acanthaster planci]
MWEVMDFSRTDREGASFNPLPQKVPMRYSFSIEQKRILMKHYEKGMHGQSLAYQDKIVACAQEAGVDFDIVRNWIGNMRRKRRMESAQRNPMPGIVLQHDQSVENKRRYLSTTSAFGGPQNLICHPPDGGQQPNQMGAAPRVIGPGLHNALPPGTVRNAPLAPRDPNVNQPSLGPVGIGQPGTSTAQAMFLTTPAKQELDADKSSCLVASTALQSTSHPQQLHVAGLNTTGVDRFPDETIPLVINQGSTVNQEVEEGEWRQQQIQKIMQQIQQSVHQLESLGCECVVASVIPSDGGTYITGTPVAVQYFSEIQKIQAMADYVNPTTPTSVTSDNVPNDAAEEVNDASNGQRKQPGQATNTKEEAGDRECLEARGGDHTEEEKAGKVDLDRRDGEIIHAGEEVYIVNKEHYIIGTGTLLPAPHKRIELKNTPL